MWDYWDYIERFFFNSFTDATLIEVGKVQVWNVGKQLCQMGLIAGCCKGGNDDMEVKQIFTTKELVTVHIVIVALPLIL